MIKKFVIVLKYLSLSIGLLIGVISCKKDFNNIGVNIVDNNIFTSDKHVSEVIAYSKNIEKNRTNAMADYLLGVQEDGVFGKLEASIIAQLSLSSINPDIGENAVIDTVIVNIPYYSTLVGQQTDPDGNNVPEFVLDSVWSKEHSSVFQLNVFELGTQLHILEPENLTEPKIYYSDDDTLIKATPLFSGLIEPDANDTLLIVDRYRHPNPNYPDLLNKEIYKTDTIKGTTTSPPPSLKIPFNKETINTIFLDNVSGNNFASNVHFQHFFKGLYFEALEHDAQSGSLMKLKMSDATMTIYYSNDVLKSEGENEDLNGNGINGEEDVWARIPESIAFPLAGIKSNLYSRDYSNSDFEPYTYPGAVDTINGEEKLFVHGAAGSNAVIKLFGEDADINGIPDELEELRLNNWLVNEARLVVYIDQNSTTNWEPKQLYLYKLGEEDTQILDAMPQSILGIGGNLETNLEGAPEKYTFLITDYISEIIKPDSDIALHDLAIKTFDIYDLPDSRYTTDTIVRKFNSNPKGLVLKGNKKPLTESERIKLEIYYTKKN